MTNEINLLHDNAFYLASNVFWKHWDVKRFGFYQSTFYFSNGALMNVLLSNFGDPFENSDTRGEEVYFISVHNKDDNAYSPKESDQTDDAIFYASLILVNNPAIYIEGYDPAISEPYLTLSLGKLVNPQLFLDTFNADYSLINIVQTE